MLYAFLMLRLCFGNALYMLLICYFHIRIILWLCLSLIGSTYLILTNTLSAMGEVTGPIEFKGKVGNLIAYRRMGKTIISMKGGASKKKVMTSKSMRNTRQNAFEFRNAVLAGSNIRHGLALRTCADQMVHSRLQGFLYKNVVREDPVHNRGERVVMPEQLKVLKDFTLNRVMYSTGNAHLRAAVWEKDDAGVYFSLPQLDLSDMKGNFDSYKVWAVVKRVHLTEKYKMVKSEKTGEERIPDYTGGETFTLNPIEAEENEVLVYAWGYQTYVDGLPLQDRRMNGVVMDSF